MDELEKLKSRYKVPYNYFDDLNKRLYQVPKQKESGKLVFLNKLKYAAAACIIGLAFFILKPKHSASLDQISSEEIEEYIMANWDDFYSMAIDGAKLDEGNLIFENIESKHIENYLDNNYDYEYYYDEAY